MDEFGASIRSKRLLSGLGAALCVGMCVACAPPADRVSRSGAATPVAVDVITAAAEFRSMAVEIEAVGTVRANESVDVTAKVANTISAIRFREGDLVRRGATLVELDDPELRAAVSEAEAVLAESEAQFSRSRALVEQQMLSSAQLEQIEATLKANRARADAARARLADTVVRAGFDGRTGFRHVSVGSLVSPGSIITTLDDVSRVKIEFTVPETYLFLLERGIVVIATTPGLPGRVFKGAIVTVDSRVDVNTRSVGVRAEIANADGALRPGMFMTVNLQTAAMPTLLVPEAAIDPEQGNAFVLVVVDDVVERRQVRVGRRRSGGVEILSGLQAGERVVVHGVQNVRPGTPVREHTAVLSGGS